MNSPFSPSTSEHFQGNDRAKPRLLVTDPDPALLLIYRAYFPKFGFDVTTATNGPECLAQLREFSPDLVVLSLELRWGGADGVLSIMREESELRPIPVVLTGCEISRLKAAELVVPPVINLLAQPFHLHDLRATVEAALSGGHSISRQNSFCQ